MAHSQARCPAAVRAVSFPIWATRRSRTMASWLSSAEREIPRRNGDCVAIRSAFCCQASDGKNIFHYELYLMKYSSHRAPIRLRLFPSSSEVELCLPDGVSTPPMTCGHVQVPRQFDGVRSPSIAQLPYSFCRRAHCNIS